MNHTYRFLFPLRLLRLCHFLYPHSNQVSFSLNCNNLPLLLPNEPPSLLSTAHPVLPPTIHIRDQPSPDLLHSTSRSTTNQSFFFTRFPCQTALPEMHVSRRPLSTSSVSSATTTSSTSTISSNARYSDRFIPSRKGSGDLHDTFDLLRRSAPAVSQSCTSENSPAISNISSPSDIPHPATKSPPSNCYSALLKSELLDVPPPSPSTHAATPAAIAAAELNDVRYATKRRSTRSSVRSHPGLEGLTHFPTASPPPHPPTEPQPLTSQRNMFRFQGERPASAEPIRGVDAAAGSFRLASQDTQKLLLSASATPGRISRKIARVPFKVLDAPFLKDDFYLNLVDWSSSNVLAVGLGSCVYLWSACTSVVTKLCDLRFGGLVCSVAWNQQGTQLAVGTMPGSVQIWDTTSCQLIRTMSGHTARAGCLAWNSSILSSGGRDKSIFNRDMRCKESFIAQLTGHKQEVCGLKWSFDDMQLASGGNDNKLLIWNSAGLGSGGTNVRTGSGSQYQSPVLKFSYHEAAVKAIAWSPHTRGLLASGGGTQDRKIRFWSTITNTALAVVDTGSQVCNLAWSKNVNEIVSTHGYSQHQIIVWKYPTLSKVVTLTGHSYRVLYLAMSPSGETIVTGAGDETLRFWNVFPSSKNNRGSSDRRSLLSPGRMSIR